MTNHGGHYDPSTGLYTAPYDGIYQLHAQMESNGSGNTVLIDFRVDGVAIGTHDDAYYQDQYRSVTLLIELLAGQTVEVYGYGGARGST